MQLSISDAAPDFVRPVSQACTQAQFRTAEFEFWCREIREPFRFHRKLWEYCYLLQALSTRGMIAPGRRGLGFGVGKEMTVAVLAARGVRVTATDLDLTSAGPEWVDTGQHASGLADLNDKWICPTDLFAKLVDFRVEDMNAISRDLENYDFAWSLCAFEHLGSLEHGLNFVKNSLRCIRPGGILVHTTEFNISSDEATLDSGPAVLFRKRDFLQLAEELTKDGHHLEVNFNLGGGELDDYVDEAPWNDRRHLRLRLGGFVSTSFGFIIRKAG